MNGKTVRSGKSHRGGGNHFLEVRGMKFIFKGKRKGKEGRKRKRLERREVGMQIWVEYS